MKYRKRIQKKEDASSSEKSNNKKVLIPIYVEGQMVPSIIRRHYNFN